MGISSTLILPEWGSINNNPDTAKYLSRTLLKYIHSEMFRGTVDQVSGYISLGIR